MAPKTKREKTPRINRGTKPSSSSSSSNGEFPILASLNLFASDITGDGNCLFRSFSDQIYGDSSNNRLIRGNVVNFMRAHSDYFSVFFDSPYDESWETYLIRMDRDGVYGDNLEIVAFAKMYQVDVVVYQRELMYVINGLPNPDDKIDDFYDFGKVEVKINGIDKILTLDGNGDDDEDNNDGGQLNRVIVYTDTLTGEKRELKLPTRIHIAYHTWEHYSSVRNITGPLTGPPQIAYMDLTANNSGQDGNGPTPTKQKDNDKWKIETVMSSLPPSDGGMAVSKLKIKRLLKENRGDVDAVIELLLEEIYNQEGVVAEEVIDEVVEELATVSPDKDKITIPEVVEPIDPLPLKTKTKIKTKTKTTTQDSDAKQPKKRESAREKKERQKRESRERKKAATKDINESAPKDKDKDKDITGIKILYV